MTDIVEQLCGISMWLRDYGLPTASKVANDGADDIKRLRAEVEELTTDNRFLRSELNGKCAVCCTQCGDMLTEDTCVACQRDEAREAARWWYRRDRRSHDPSVITDQLQLWPWLEEGR